MQSAPVAILLLLGLCAAASASENFFKDPQYDEAKGVAGQGCCLPTEWEGRVGSFYMKKRFLRPIFRISDSKVGFDYKNQRSGARSMFYCRKTKKVYTARSVADYKAKKAYFIYKNKCKVYSFKADLKRPCIPGNFKRYAPYNYGAGSTSLDLWPYGLRNQRLEYFLVVTRNSCVPIKGAYRTRKGRRTITYGKYQFYNITTGIRDPSLYTVPASCKTATVEETAPSGFLNRLKSYISSTNTPLGDSSELSPAHDEMTSHVSELINGNAKMLWSQKPSRASRLMKRLRNKFE